MDLRVNRQMTGKGFLPAYGKSPETQNLPARLVIQRCYFKNELGASLVAQWLGICLPMQGTQV